VDLIEFMEENSCSYVYVEANIVNNESANCFMEVNEFGRLFHSIRIRFSVFNFRFDNQIVLFTRLENGKYRLRRF